MATTALALRDYGRRKDRRWLWIAPPVLVGAAGGGTFAASLVTGGHFYFIFFLAVGFLPVVIWRHPQVGGVVLVASATLIEQFGGDLATGVVTGKIPLFSSLQDAFHLQGIFVNPFELLMATLLLFWVLKAGATRTLRLPRSPLAALILVLILIVVLTELVGLSHGGNFSFSLWEMRPWIYLGASYLIAASVIRDERSRSAILWTFAIGSGIKGIQGVINAIQVRNVVPKPEAILAHEEAFFFGLFIVLTVTLWVFKERGRLRVWCTVLVPFVVYANLVNDRRTAWLIVALGLATMIVIAWLRFPLRRARLARGLALLGFVMVIYGAAFWNNTSTLGQPVRAFRSAVAPTQRDKESNQYRVLEDRNLQLNILQSFPLGKGFGVPIDYEIPIVDLSGSNALIKYVPHDDVLYVWMRMGVQGMVVFWCMIAAAVIAVCRLARHGDRHTAVIATFTLAAIAGYLIQGTYDYGFFWFRMAILMGVLFGISEGMRVTEPEPDVVKPNAVAGPRPAASRAAGL
jgi:hypothetical protein